MFSNRKTPTIGGLIMAFMIAICVLISPAAAQNQDDRTCTNKVSPCEPKERKAKKDSDRDGMPNRWERKYKLDPKNKRDAKKDPDKDNLSNKSEYKAGTNPRDNDTDTDGINDGWEVANDLDPLDENDALEDSDGDGNSNYDEYENETDPQDDDDFLDCDDAAEFRAAATKSLNQSNLDDSTDSCFI